MTTNETKHTADLLADARNVAAKWHGRQDELDRLRAENARLRDALRLLHDNLAEYQRINNLGGYDNHDMRMARAALAQHD